MSSNPQGNPDRAAAPLEASPTSPDRDHESAPTAPPPAPQLAPPLIPPLIPQSPSRGFTWGWRTGLAGATAIFGGVALWNYATADRPVPTIGVVLLALAVALTVVTLIEAWRWAAHPRLSPAQSRALCANLTPETKRAVHRLALGRGPDVPELRPWAAAWVQSQRQDIALGPTVLALTTVSNLSLGSTGPLTVALVSHTRRYRPLSACFRCLIAGLSLRMCWHCWMCQFWPHVSTLTKRGCAICARSIAKVSSHPKPSPKTRIS